MSLLSRLAAGLVLTLVTCVTARAQVTKQNEPDDSLAYAYAHATPGPAKIALGEGATLQLPAGFVFVPENVSRRITSLPNTVTGRTHFGIVIPAVHYNGWLLAVNKLDTGHVPSSAIVSWDHDEVRDTLRGAVRRANPARVQFGLGPIDIGAWLSPPLYDAGRNRFTSAARVVETGPSTSDEDGILVTAVMFGRSDAIEISLFASSSNGESGHAALDRLADAVEFQPGHRVADFVAGHDPVASKVLDVVFGGRTQTEITTEAVEAAAEAKRRAELPPARNFSRPMMLAFFGMLGLMALAAAAIALRGGGRASEKAPSRDRSVNRALRTAPRQ